jgi:hypothetical protein
MNQKLLREIEKAEKVDLERVLYIDLETSTLICPMLHKFPEIL